jgi:hypothetical protein
MKYVLSFFIIFLLQNCLYNLKHINRIDDSERNWTIEEKKTSKTK